MISLIHCSASKCRHQKNRAMDANDQLCGISEAKRIWDSAGMTAESLCVACLFEDEALLREQLDLSICLVPELL